MKTLYSGLHKNRPTAFEMMEAMLFILCDEEKGCDAVFVHAPAVKDAKEDDKILRLAVELNHKKPHPFVAINGLSAEQCSGLGMPYPGWENWVAKLIKLGVRKEHIVILPPSWNTPAESNNFILEAKKKKWRALTIISAPHHQLRAFLQIIASMKKLGIHVNVYNKTHHEIDWKKILTKQMINLNDKNNPKFAEIIRGTMLEHVKEEYERIVKYARKDGGHERNATIPEMFKYLKFRDKLNG